MSVHCDYCGRAALLVGGGELYPHRSDLSALNFWKCTPCEAWVSCHQPGNGQGDGTKPMGRLANAQLRSARRDAHASFDSLWRDGAMSRSRAYAWLAAALGISREQCHIGIFDVDDCFAVVHAVAQRAPEGRPGNRVGGSCAK